jgi:hypothetical protein
MLGVWTWSFQLLHEKTCELCFVVVRYFPNATLDGCPRLWDISASLEPSSCTVLLDTVTGELVRILTGCEIPEYNCLLKAVLSGPALDRVGPHVG